MCHTFLYWLVSPREQSNIRRDAKRLARAGSVTQGYPGELLQDHGSAAPGLSSPRCCATNCARYGYPRYCASARCCDRGMRLAISICSVRVRAPGMGDSGLPRKTSRCTGAAARLRPEPPACALAVVAAEAFDQRRFIGQFIDRLRRGADAPSFALCKFSAPRCLSRRAFVPPVDHRSC